MVMRLLPALLTVLPIILLAACGQRGPLYLPDNPPAGIRKPQAPVPKPVPYPAESGAPRDKPG